MVGDGLGYLEASLVTCLAPGRLNSWGSPGISVCLSLIFPQVSLSVAVSVSQTSCVAAEPLSTGGLQISAFPTQLHPLGMKENR